MNANDLNAALYEKMAAEQDQYRDWLKSQPPEEILHHAYEYSVREDIVMAMEELELTDAQAQALLDSSSPLADVYRYFEKLETAHMDVVRDSIENRADDVCRAKEELRTTTTYSHTAAYASEHGEREQYRASNRANLQCKEAIEAAVREHFDGMYLNQDAAKGVIQTYGLDRVMLVLANTVQLQDWDGRYSHRNKEWAKTIPNYNSDTVRRGYALNSHPAVLDGFIDLVREEQQRSHTKGERRSNPELRYGISSNRNRPPISLSPKRNGSRSDDCPEPQAGGAGKLPGITGGAGADRAENVPAGDSQPGSLSAKDGAGRLCGEAGIAGAEGACFPFAPVQQQLKSAHAPGA